MRRFRIVFALVAVALLVPTALLARRALVSVELERTARHQAVAERLFDEMERALSEFLATEESRAFGEYAHEYTPPGDRAGALVRSPLAGAPTEPFVVGYFQVDPDGSLHLPNEPAGAPQAVAATTELRRKVAPYWRSGPKNGNLRENEIAQAPGSTLELDEVAAAAEPKLDKLSAAKKKSDVSAYDAFRALNRGAEQRADRQTKVSKEYAKQALEPSLGASLQQLGDDGLEKRESSSRLEGQSPRGRRAATRNQIDQFELSPMVGAPVGERRLILYRTVVHETQGYRQGLLVDLDKLGQWLRQRAVGPELSGYAWVTFGDQPARAEGQIAYLHRFAEPFESVSAHLALAALPGVGGAGSVYALAAFSLFATLAGLAALYRMIAVTLRFAEQRSNFVAAVTHELRTPLTAIRMYGEMLRDGMVASDAKRDEYHRHITAESERLTRLVNNVLELSRLEKGTRPAKLETGDVGTVIREAAELVRPHVEAGGFTLRIDCAPDLPVARFERDAVMQVLFNLVDNAVKYADGAAKKEIVIGAREDGRALSIFVRDHGPGVAANLLPRIFEPFVRGESELTRRRKGTGLGLALVQGLSAEMGARVRGGNRAEGGFEVEIAFPPATVG